MPALIDDVIAGKASIDGHPLPPQVIDQYLRAATVIHVDPVVDFYFSSPKYDHDFAFARDDAIDAFFPNLAPPFKLFWLEARMPARVLVEGVFRDMRSSWIKRVGALFASAKIDSGWQVEVHPFIHTRVNEIYKWASSLIIAVNPDGRPGPFSSWKTSVIASMSEDEKQQASEIASSICTPLLLAVSFMHCKNVSLRPSDPPSEKLARRYEERHGTSMVKSYVLDIAPMREVLRTEGQSASVGVQRALHICRGHFKDYRDGGGLFGKHKGLYWWEPAARGTTAAGVIDKDYRVHPKVSE